MVGLRISDRFDPSTPMALTDEQIEDIAERAANKAIAKITQDFYAHVGKTMVQRVFIWIGAVVIGIALANGWIALK